MGGVSGVRPGDGAGVVALEAFDFLLRLDGGAAGEDGGDDAGVDAASDEICPLSAPGLGEGGEVALEVGEADASHAGDAVEGEPVGQFGFGVGGSAVGSLMAGDCSTERAGGGGGWLPRRSGGDYDGRAFIREEEKR